MEASTTICGLLRAGKIFVPSYQRAYSWDTEKDSGKSPKQVNVFLSDLEDYRKSAANPPYYFGHFLFEEHAGIYGVIDGQQRLTTIIIFLSALFRRLTTLREGKLTEKERELFEDMVKRNSTYRFETVDYDSQPFKDYVIDQSKHDHNGLETESARRIVNAFDFFVAHLADKDEDYLTRMLNIVCCASCTTHPVKNESEAIQMFIFQNNRGKRPSNLEIIKAQFMFNVHLYAGEAKAGLLEEIKNRFEKIYKSISAIEYRIDEDEVLVYTLRVHFNSLGESNALDKINSLLSKESIPFVKTFTQSLADSFEYLTVFFGRHERENQSVHSLVSLGGIGVALPFVIKAYKFNLPIEQIGVLCSKLESILLRQRLVGTRADMPSRLNGVYQKFTAENTSLDPIIKHIDWMRTVESSSLWWAYWNNDALSRAIQGWIPHPTAKFLLWKYENHLKGQGKGGYLPTRFDSITAPELEHIAPQTPPDGKPVEAGYPEYDEDFKAQLLNCLGNYLLLSKSHNCSVGNSPFAEKRNSYSHLEQHREIHQLTDPNNPLWTKELIQKRKEKIVRFILDNL
ncbi:MAG: DUF262 domain-containing HNH endonuclease family protein [Verrucomicrobiota bacterium]